MIFLLSISINDLTLTFSARLLRFENLYPVPVGVRDKIQPHCFVFVANAAHLAVKSAYRVVIAVNAKAQVRFVVAQVVRLVPVAHPRQLNRKRSVFLAKKNKGKRAVIRVFSAFFGQSQRFVVKRDTFVEILHVAIVMIKSTFNVHNASCYT